MPLPFPRLDPLTKKRLARFRSMRRGFWALLAFLFLFVLSLFANFIANSRALVVSYEGNLYFPTYKFYSMKTFGQKDDFGFDDSEAEYRRLADELKANGKGWVLMPPIPWSPYESDFSYADPPPHPPDSRHWLGTDMSGRDVLVRLLYGFRVSILFALALIFAVNILGTFIGSVLGYLGGRADLFGQRFIEVWQSLPQLYIIIIMGTLFTPSAPLLLLVMTAFDWIGMTYYMRAEMYREKSREYCMAARSVGASHFRVVFSHLLPNCLTPLITLTPFSIVAAISGLTALDYLGYGLPPPTPSWGELIDQALQSSNRDKLWLSLSPFVAITVTLMLITLIGEAVREAFDPKAYSRYR